MTSPLDPPVRLLAGFDTRCGGEPDLVVGASGRAAWAAARFTGASFYVVHDADSPRRARFDLRGARRGITLYRRPIPAWARYLAGVTALSDLQSLPGAEIVVCSDEPAGPRRDHALGMVAAALWHTINDLPTEEADLFQIAERARREYVEIGARPTIYAGGRS